MPANVQLGTTLSERIQKSTHTPIIQICCASCCNHLLLVTRAKKNDTLLEIKPSAKIPPPSLRLQLCKIAAYRSSSVRTKRIVVSCSA